MEKYKLRHNRSAKQYEFEIDGVTAFVEYTKPSDKIACLTHTFVPHELSGKGIGAALVEAVLEKMKKTGIRIVPQCDFIAHYIARNPQWNEIVLNEITVK